MSYSGLPKTLSPQHRRQDKLKSSNGPDLSRIKCKILRVFLLGLIAKSWSNLPADLWPAQPPGLHRQTQAKRLSGLSFPPAMILPDLEIKPTSPWRQVDSSLKHQVLSLFSVNISVRFVHENEFDLTHLPASITENPWMWFVTDEFCYTTGLQLKFL